MTHVDRTFFYARPTSHPCRAGEGKGSSCRCEGANGGPPASPEACGTCATCRCAGEGLSCNAGEGLSSFLRTRPESVSAAAPLAIPAARCAATRPGGNAACSSGRTPRRCSTGSSAPEAGRSRHRPATARISRKREKFPPAFCGREAMGHPTHKYKKDWRGAQPEKKCTCTAGTNCRHK